MKLLVFGAARFLERRQVVRFIAGCAVSAPLLACTAAEFSRGRAIGTSPTLSRSLQQLAAQASPGILGVGILDLETGSYTAVNGDRPFPMQSVFKAALGAAVLAEVDAGRVSLESTVQLSKGDLSPPYSPIAEAWPGRSSYTVRELLEQTVGGSDNTGADVLMRLIGGPSRVNAFLRAHAVHGMRVDRYEREFQTEAVGLGEFREEWLGENAFVAALESVPEDRRRAAMRRYLTDVRDTSTPRASAVFLSKLAAGELLSTGSTRLLLDIMSRTGTGARRLKAGLPAGAVIAHKTGTGRPYAGISPAVNDIGIITLPDGRRFAVASFLAGSTLPEAERERLHSEVAKALIASLLPRNRRPRSEPGPA